MVNRDLLQAAVRELLVIAGLVLVVALLAGWSLHQGLREVALLALGSFIFWGWRALARYDAQGDAAEAVTAAETAETSTAELARRVGI